MYTVQYIPVLLPLQLGDPAPVLLRQVPLLGGQQVEGDGALEAAVRKVKHGQGRVQGQLRAALILRDDRVAKKRLYGGWGGGRREKAPKQM